LPLDQTGKFSVFEREKVTLAVGDRIRFTKKRQASRSKVPNNELRTVVGIDEGKIVFDKGEIVRNGAALHVDQGIAFISHASQAKTVDQVIASVPVRSFSQANEAQFYVTMSRARLAMHVFTDSKVALRDAGGPPVVFFNDSWGASGLVTRIPGLKVDVHEKTCLDADSTTS
jgi:hypothetical protein